MEVRSVIAWRKAEWVKLLIPLLVCVWALLLCLLCDGETSFSRLRSWQRCTPAAVRGRKRSLLKTERICVISTIVTKKPSFWLQHLSHSTSLLRIVWFDMTYWGGRKWEVQRSNRSKQRQAERRRQNQVAPEANKLAPGMKSSQKKWRATSNRPEPRGSEGTGRGKEKVRH